jgi:hypothetical protein
MWLGTRRRFSDDAPAQRDRIAKPIAFADTPTNPLSYHIAFAGSLACVFPAAGGNVIAGDDYRPSRRLASGI